MQHLLQGRTHAEVTTVSKCAREPLRARHHNSSGVPVSCPMRRPDCRCPAAPRKNVPAVSCITMIAGKTTAATLTGSWQAFRPPFRVNAVQEPSGVNRRKVHSGRRSHADEQL